MRCSNCLSHRVEIKFDRGVCADCGAVIDLKFADGTNALPRDRGIFGNFHLKSIPGVTFVLLVMISLAALVYVIGVQTSDKIPTAENVRFGITSQSAESSQRESFAAGELIRTLDVSGYNSVEFSSGTSNQSMLAVAQPPLDSIQPVELFELLADGTIQFHKLPADVVPLAVTRYSENVLLVAYESSENLVIAAVDAFGEVLWRRPIFLDGLTVKRVSLSSVESTILVDTSMQEADKTVQYLLAPDGRLTSLRTHEGNDLPAALLQPDGSVVSTDTLLLSDPFERVWSVTNTDANGRVTWKTRLPIVDVENYSKTIVTEQGDIFALKADAKTLVKISADGTIQWQAPVDLLADFETVELAEGLDGRILIVALSEGLDSNSILRVHGYTPDGDLIPAQYFDLKPMITQSEFLIGPDRSVYLIGKRETEQTNTSHKVVIYRLNETVTGGTVLGAAIAPTRATPTNTAAPRRPVETPVAPPVERPAETIQVAVIPAAPSDPNAIDWSEVQFAECRFVCLDASGASLRMGQTVSPGEAASAPDLDRAHKEICQLARALPDSEQVPICEVISQ